MSREEVKAEGMAEETETTVTMTRSAIDVASMGISLEIARQKMTAKMLTGDSSKMVVATVVIADHLVMAIVMTDQAMVVMAAAVKTE